MKHSPEITVALASIEEVSVDVIALKYAQAYYGADERIASLLTAGGEDPELLRPRRGTHQLVPGRVGVAARNVLVLGVPPLRQFGYREIREFARLVLENLADVAPETRSVAVTLHGPGYGLDEMEAFDAEIAGFLDAINEGALPPDLQRIVVVERNRGRFERMKEALADLVPDSARRSREVVDLSEARTERLRAAGYASDSKAHVFVAMPFREEMEDVYHYGIQPAVRDAGFLCERADLAAFTR